MEASTDAKRVGLDEGIVEEESELFLVGGKMIGKSFGRQLWP